MSVVGKWMHLGTVTSSEINQTHELQCYMASFIRETQSRNKEQNKSQIKGSRAIELPHMGKRPRDGRVGFNKTKLISTRKSSGSALNSAVVLSHASSS